MVARNHVGHGAAGRFYRACRQFVAAGGVPMLAFWAFAGAGCSAPDAATTNRTEPAETYQANRTLSPSDQDAVLRAMEITTEGHAARPLIAAPGGYRWSDVPGALRAAAGSCFLGVGAIAQTDDEVVATLQMADGQRGQATVSRGERGVQARVTLGAFGQPKQEQEFVNAFHKALTRMGAVRRPQESAKATP